MNMHTVSNQEYQLPDLIKDLGNNDGLVRQRARLQIW